MAIRLDQALRLVDTLNKKVTKLQKLLGEDQAELKTLRKAVNKDKKLKGFSGSES